MAQIFHRSANTLARASILGVVLLLSAVGAALMEFQRSPYVTGQHIAPEQPIPFSHKIHVGEVKLVCSDCHTEPEKFGDPVSIPDAPRCLECHAYSTLATPISPA